MSSRSLHPTSGRPRVGHLYFYLSIYSNVIYLSIFLSLSLSLSLSFSLSLSLSLSISLSFLPISLGFSPIVNLRMQRIFWIGCSIGFFWSKKEIFGRPQICSRVRPPPRLTGPRVRPFPSPQWFRQIKLRIYLIRPVLF